MHTFSTLMISSAMSLGIMPLTSEKIFDERDFKILEQTAKELEFSGSMAIFQGDQLVFHFSGGEANPETGLENDLNVRFNIGSIGKSLTSILIFRQVETGNIDLDQTIDQYLPEDERVPNDSLITVRHLLTNTSGLGDFFDSPDYVESQRYDVESLFPLVQKMALIKERPGMGLDYSNSGFIVLGRILEHLHGKSYQSIVQDELLNVLNINYSNPFNYASGWKLENENWVLGEGNDPASWSSAGGIFLSIQELHRLISFLVHDGYLDQETRELMWKPQVQPSHEPPFVHYAFGWMVEKPQDLHFIGHNGGVRGFQAAFRYLPQTDTYIYTFSNRENGAEGLFMKALMQLIQKAE
ncbi:serine hydrolase [Algoriphagus sp. AK58]|uniref:serine hydrolase domain-containing protein n=1 Tax=Algoriphagus sp. AK58 TaxID=1406877 RepID=UPI001650834A|nr:serine hydrolase domain-containing protein [Algoriphagus sp. AK58]MBC6366213.1 hypothetical protein [Algoriphagus sp. AK58]